MNCPSIGSGNTGMPPGGPARNDVRHRADGPWGPRGAHAGRRRQGRRGLPHPQGGNLRPETGRRRQGLHLRANNQSHGVAEAAVGNAAVQWFIPWRSSLLPLVGVQRRLSPPPRGLSAIPLPPLPEAEAELRKAVEVAYPHPRRRRPTGHPPLHLSNVWKDSHFGRRFTLNQTISEMPMPTGVEVAPNPETQPPSA